MGLSRVIYNGFEFPDRSHLKITEQFIYDDSGINVTHTMFSMKIETIIIADDQSPSPGNYEDDSYFAGRTMHKIRQLLSKPGKLLQVEHDGFGPRPHLQIGGSSGNPVKDINFGPKPRVISWDPIGDTAACEIVWECDFCLPICDGITPPRFTGISALNYAIGYDIDRRGYTTRRITGYLEIANNRMPGNFRSAADSVDQYRDKLVVMKPANFTRDVSWNVSTDKRRADFSIADTEIASNNIYPSGVVAISARHRVGWNRRSRMNLPNTITATIELAPDQPRVRAWEIFRAIVTNRTSYAGTARPIFLETFEIDEELFENKISFSVTYYILLAKGIGEFFNASGILQPVIEQGHTWDKWSTSVDKFQPFQNKGTDRGFAKLSHDYLNEKYIDLCDSNVTIPPSVSPAIPAIPPYPPFPLPVPSPSGPTDPTGSTYGSLLNKRPPLEKSWLVFEASFTYETQTTTGDMVAIELGPNDLTDQEFSSSNPGANMKDGITTNALNQRWVESNAAPVTLIWRGYAERIGWEIPRPGRLRIGNAIYKPTSSAQGNKFHQKFEGDFNGQPKYSASWEYRYALYATIKPDGGFQVANPVNQPEAP